MSQRNAKRNAEIVRRREAGQGPRAIARAMNLSPSCVAGVLWRAGLTLPTNGRGNGATEAFIELVVADARAVSQAQAARTWGVSQQAISEWCRARTA